MVRKGVRTLMQQVAQIEREKDDYKAQLCTAKKQLQESGEQHGRSENKISKLQQTLRAVQEDKANLEAKIQQKDSMLGNVDEALKQKTLEANGLREKVTSLELQLGSGTEERGQCEVIIERYLILNLLKIPFVVGPFGEMSPEWSATRVREASSSGRAGTL